MLFKKTMQKTKNFFQKTLQNLRKFLFGNYDNLPRTFFLNPLSCSSINQRCHHLDHIYPEFSDSNQPSVSEYDNHSMKQFINTTDANDSSTEVISSAYEITDETAKQVAASKKNQTSSSSTSASFRYAIANGGSYILAQKMKELEMMDIGDVDHTLDVEEALHYYSRLTCPEYVDIVNKFFMDMYSDFHLPQPSISISSSSRRLGPLALQSNQ